MNAALILNPAAGSLQGQGAAASPEDLQAAFHAEGIDASLRLAEPGRLCDAVHAAVAAGAQAIFVGGGDGTISTAAGCLAGRAIPLGVLPLGTLNHFARDLGMPADWREAVTALAHGTVRTTDLGEVNGRVFINNCSLGAYASAVRKRDTLRRQRGWGKWLAMTLATFDEFRRLRRLRVRLDIVDADSVRMRTPFVLIANNAYSGHVLDSSLRPRLDEGRLWIYSTRAHRRLTLLRLAWQTLTRKIDETDALEKIDVDDATLVNEHDTPSPLAIDGELVHLRPPFHFRILPGALRVLAPTPT